MEAIKEKFDKLQSFFTLKKFEFNKNKKLFLIAVGIILVLIVIAYLIYIFFFDEENKKSSGTFFFGRIYSDYSTVLSNDDIIKPLTLDGFTFSFWLDIKDYYQNNGYWRHLFHKGTPISKKSTLDYTYWDNLESDISMQCPGVWLFPSENKLRFAFTTSSNESYFINQHAFKVTTAPTYEVREKELSKEKLEFCDLPNIPINELVHIVMVLDRRNVQLFMNNKLVKTCNLLGDPQYNNADTYFSYSKTYSGYISNFTYIPLVANSHKIKNLYLDKPEKD